MAEQLKKSEQEWKAALDEQEYHVLREKGTERPFTGKYHAEKAKGVYKCKGCGAPLFSSDTKFDSGTGWPSFSDTMDNENIRTRVDNSHFMTRVEVLCAKCGGHLGHVFPDGPTPTGMRYCINSCSLDLEKEGVAKK
jgi:peptide-methionine (R)-S-oxide reductase